ncbi:hypothetical protein HUU59_03555, partial [bacterium]|nr:hypothetical protein [bacterium]
MKRILLPILLLAFLALPAYAGDDAACVDCHSDATLTRTNKDGTITSLCVTSDSLAKTKHAKLACVDCHADLKGFDDFPHDEDLAAVNCAACHKDVAAQVAMGGHEGVLKCAACHGTHNMHPITGGDSKADRVRIDRSCEQCHNRMHSPVRGRTAAYESYDVGIHGRLAKAGKEGLPGCTECHTAHSVHSEDRLPAKLEEACLNCHT